MFQAAANQDVGSRRQDVRIIIMNKNLLKKNQAVRPDFFCSILDLSLVFGK